MIGTQLPRREPSDKLQTREQPNLSSNPDLGSSTLVVVLFDVRIWICSCSTARARAQGFKFPFARAVEASEPQIR